MLKVLSYILCDLDPKVKVIGQKAGICDGVPSTSALVLKMQYYSYFFTLKCHLRVKIQKFFLTRFARSDFINRIIYSYKRHAVEGNLKAGALYFVHLGSIYFQAPHPSI